MSISVSSKTSNAMTVACSYPPYVAPVSKPMSLSEGCNITWNWSASGSTSSKPMTDVFGCSIRWKWTWSGSSWTEAGWDPLNVASSESYSDGDGYSGTLTLQGVSPGSRPSPPATGSYPVGTGGHVDAGTGTATYTGNVSKTTYSWVPNGWSHSTPSTYSYSDGTYSGTLNRDSVSEGSRPGTPSSPPTSSTSTTSITAGTGTVYYSGTVSTTGSGAVITRTKMYLNGSYRSDGSASNNFSYTFTGLAPGTSYTLTVQWFSSGDTLVGANDTTDITLDTTPSQPTVTSRGEGSLTLSWGSVAGATNYQLDYKPTVNTVWNPVTTSSTSTFLSGLAYGLGYDFRVRAFVDGVWSSFSATSNATVNPKTPSISGDYAGGVVTIIVGGMGGTTFDSVTVERRLISSDAFVDSKSVTVNGGSVAWTISSSIIANYKFRAYSTEGSVSSVNYSNVLSFVRPVNFAFQYSTISKGSNAIVDRRDWNNLAAKINEFRAYKELSPYTFTTITSGITDITAVLFNQLVSAANGLSSFMTNNVMPSATSKGADFDASYLNNIVSSINSIS